MFFGEARLVATRGPRVWNGNQIGFSNDMKSRLNKKNRGFYARGFVGAVRELPLLIRTRKIRASFE